jgi:hypothetical protein
LDIKHILLDTLLWIILPSIYQSTITNENQLASFFQQISDFFDENSKFTIDYVVRAFTNGSYSKVFLVYFLI